MGSNHYQPPRVGWWKINTDAACTEGKVGLGMVVRDRDEDMVMASGCHLEVTVPPQQAEARAVLFSLSYAFEARYRKVELESDCQTLVSMLTRKKVENSDVQMIVNDVFSLINSFDDCCFNFTKRTCNMAAHLLAKASLTLRSLWSG